MVRSAARSVLACILAGSLLPVVACGGRARGSTAPHPSRAVAAPASPGAPGSFGGTDLAWVEITIAMDEQLMPLLELVPAHSARTDVSALAAAVQDTCRQELAVLRRLRDQAGLPAANPHAGMPMPGMVTAGQVAAAAAATGAAFDARLLRLLTAHLRQGVRLATSERSAGVEPQTLALARQVLDDRAADLQRVQALLAH